MNQARRVLLLFLWPALLVTRQSLGNDFVDCSSQLTFAAMGGLDHRRFSSDTELETFLARTRISMSHVLGPRWQRWSPDTPSKKYAGRTTIHLEVDHNRKITQLIRGQFHRSWTPASQLSVSANYGLHHIELIGESGIIRTFRWNGQHPDLTWVLKEQKTLEPLEFEILGPGFYRQNSRTKFEEFEKRIRETFDRDTQMLVETSSGWKRLGPISTYPQLVGKKIRGLEIDRNRQSIHWIEGTVEKYFETVPQGPFNLSASKVRVQLEGSGQTGKTGVLTLSPHPDFVVWVHEP